MNSTEYMYDGSVEQRNNYYPYGGLLNDVTNTMDVQTRKYNGKELDRMHGLDLYDYSARQYDAALGCFTSMDPLCEKYYHISPYAYCAGNPVKYVDPDGREVRADEQSQNNIKKMLNDDEQNYISFDSNGILNMDRLSLCKSESPIVDALKVLSASNLIYDISVAERDDEGVAFYDTPTNFYRGITEIPGAPQDGNPSPCNDVMIRVGKDLNERQQILTTAHEAFGHGYIYEKTRDYYKTVHTYETFTHRIGEGPYDIEIEKRKNNYLLESQIEKVVNQAKENYAKYH